MSDLTRDEAVDLVTAVGGDATVPATDPDAAEGERASAVCESFLPSVGEGASVGVAIADAAGSIAALLGDAAIEPWKSLPQDHLVVRCSYLLPPVGEPSTTICPDGDAVSLADPVQFLVDEDGAGSPRRHRRPRTLPVELDFDCLPGNWPTMARETLNRQVRPARRCSQSA